MRGTKVRSLALAATMALVTSGVTQAAEIKVVATAAVKDIFQDLVPKYEAATGDKVTTSWSSSIAIKGLIEKGEAFDLVITSAPDIESLAQAGKLVAGSRVDLATSGVGIAIKAGAPRPDISSAEAVKKAMLAARSVAFSGGPSGVYIQRLFEKLGIASQMAATAKQTAPGVRVAVYIARGDADLGFQQVAEMIHEPGIDFLGPLPVEIQNTTVFSSGVVTASASQNAAKAFQAFLTAPEAAQAIRKNGMDVPRH